ncbi:MAG: hypothetical protein ACETWC_08665 [Acidobacteriota bacterium]
MRLYRFGSPSNSLMMIYAISPARTDEYKIEDSATWHFAYKNGLFVKHIFQGFAKATATVIGPQNMTIPITQKIKIETKLVK